MRLHLLFKISAHRLDYGDRSRWRRGPRQGLCDVEPMSPATTALTLAPDAVRGASCLGGDAGRLVEQLQLQARASSGFFASTAA
jgi:hypothetical protein